MSDLSDSRMMRLRWSGDGVFPVTLSDHPGPHRASALGPRRPFVADVRVFVDALPPGMTMDAAPARMRCYVDAAYSYCLGEGLMWVVMSQADEDFSIWTSAQPRGPGQLGLRGAVLNASAQIAKIVTVADYGEQASGEIRKREVAFAPSRDEPMDQATTSTIQVFVGLARMRRSSACSRSWFAGSGALHPRPRLLCLLEEMSTVRRTPRNNTVTVRTRRSRVGQAGWLRAATTVSVMDSLVTRGGSTTDPAFGNNQLYSCVAVMPYHRREIHDTHYRICRGYSFLHRSE
jgi:hypothetical protein